MARVPAPTRESVPQDQLDAFDEFVALRGGVPDGGPLSVMLNVPDLLKRGEHLRAYLRGEGSSLPRLMVCNVPVDAELIARLEAAGADRVTVAVSADAGEDPLRGLEELASALIG